MFVSLFGTRDVTILPTFNRRHKKSAKSHPLRPSSGAILPIYIRWHLPIYIRFTPSYLQSMTSQSNLPQNSWRHISDCQPPNVTILPIYNRWHLPIHNRCHPSYLQPMTSQSNLPQNSWPHISDCQPPNVTILPAKELKAS